MGSTSVVGLSVLHRVTSEGLMQFNLLELLCQFLIDWLTCDPTTTPGKMLKLCSLNAFILHGIPVDYMVELTT